MSCITTYLKKRFDPTNASADDLDIRDIAHALSLLCRANGHFPFFYSVAQHSLNCANEAKARGCSPRVQLGCLLHDASEAYLSDITRPVKEKLTQYLEIEEKIQNIIFDKWISPPLNEQERKAIFEIDDAVLYHEFFCLMKEKISPEEPELVSTLQCGLTDFSEIENLYIRDFLTLEKRKEKRFVGVDWVQGNWLAVELCGSVACYSLFETVDKLCGYYENTDVILIDVPIGLPENSDQVKKTSRSSCS